MRPVRLLKPYGPLNVGEVGGYSEAQAARMIAAGVARPLDADPPPAPENRDPAPEADRDGAGEATQRDPPPRRRRR